LVYPKSFALSAFIRSIRQIRVQGFDLAFSRFSSTPLWNGLDHFRAPFILQASPPSVPALNYPRYLLA
jgi:hypothetical protein